MHLLNIFSILFCISIKLQIVKSVEFHVMGLNADISYSHFKVKFVGGTAHSLVIGGKELIGHAKGFYCLINGSTNFSAKS
jgi:hypothetical protein